MLLSFCFYLSAHHRILHLLTPSCPTRRSSDLTDYIRGNALARTGRYEDAIKAYDLALAQQPGMADAIANRRLVEAAKRQKSRPGNEQQSQNGRPEPCKPGDTDCYGKSDDPEDPKRPSDGPEGDSGEPSQDEDRKSVV